MAVKANKQKLVAINLPNFKNYNLQQLEIENDIRFATFLSCCG